MAAGHGLSTALQAPRTGFVRCVLGRLGGRVMRRCPGSTVRGRRGCGYRGGVRCQPHISAPCKSCSETVAKHAIDSLQNMLRCCQARAATAPRPPPHGLPLRLSTARRPGPLPAPHRGRRASRAAPERGGGAHRGAQGMWKDRNRPPRCRQRGVPRRRPQSSRSGQKPTLGLSWTAQNHVSLMSGKSRPNSGIRFAAPPI